MRRKSFSDMNCSIAQTLEVVGEWWSLLIVRDCFLGLTRFDDFQEKLGISRNILIDRLDYLVHKGVLVRVPYQDHPVRNDYKLTDKGRDLWMVIAAMRQWGDRWESEGGAPVVIEHRSCGHTATMVPTCSECGEMLEADAIRVLQGPGSAVRPTHPLPVPAHG